MQTYHRNRNTDRNTRCNTLMHVIWLFEAQEATSDVNKHSHTHTNLKLVLLIVLVSSRGLNYVDKTKPPAQPALITHICLTLHSHRSATNDSWIQFSLANTQTLTPDIQHLLHLAQTSTQGAVRASTYSLKTAGYATTFCMLISSH